MAQESQILILEVQAKMDEAIAKVQALTNAIDELQSRTGQASLIKIEGGIRKTGEASKKATKQVDDLREKQEALARTNKAGAYTLLQFNRVVSDSPFGILGIANNLDGLVQSFQNLQVQARAGGSVLGSLSAALASPAGIALAVSAVTSALIAFGPQLKEFFFGLDKAGEAAKKAEENIGKLAENFAKEVIDFGSLVSFATNANKSLDERRKAIKALQEEYPEFLKGIETEADLTKKADDVTKNYIQTLLRRAVIQQLKDDLAALIAVEAKQLIQAERQRVELEQQITLEKQRKEAIKQNKNFFDSAASAAQKYAGELRNITSAQRLQAQDRQATTPDEIQKRVIETLTKQFDLIGKIAEKYTDLTGALDDNNKKKDEDDKKTKRLAKGQLEYLEILGELRAEYEQLQQINYFESEERKLRKLIEAQKKARELVFQAANNELVSPEGLSKINELPKAIQDAIAAMDAFKKKGEETQAIIENTFNRTAAVFDLLNPAIDQAFNALANGQSVTDALDQALKRLIVQLAVATVKAAILAGIMASLFPGGGAAAAGFGFGDILQRLLGIPAKLTARASGGFLQAGQLATVGEVGRELFVPQTSGTIVPNSALGGGQIIPTIEFSYDQLRLAFNRSNSSARRRF